MRIHQHIALWIAFVLVGVLSWIVYLKLTILNTYFLILEILAVIEFVLAVRILILTRFAWRVTLLVLFLFVAAQWWMIVWHIVFLIWIIRGFSS